MNRQNWVLVRLISWSVTAIALIAILFLGLSGKIGWNIWSFGGIGTGYHYADASRYTAGGAKLDGDDVDRLDVDWIDGKIKIEVYEGDTVQFFEKSSQKLKENEQLHYYNKNGRLIIRYKKAERKMFANSRGKELTIKVPEDTAKSLKTVNVDTVSSDTNVKGIDANKLVLNSTSGDFEIIDCRMSDLNLDSTSGGLIGTSLEITDMLNANTTSGDVKISGAVKEINYDTVSGDLTVESKICPKRVKTDSVSGSVTLSIPQNEGFTFSKDTVSGTLASEFDLSYEDDEGIYKNGEAKFDCGSVSGDFTINQL